MSILNYVQFAGQKLHCSRVHQLIYKFLPRKLHIGLSGHWHYFVCFLVSFFIFFCFGYVC